MNKILVVAFLASLSLVAFGQEQEGPIVVDPKIDNVQLMSDGPITVDPKLYDIDRIVGGTKAALHSRPWQVHLRNGAGGLCGGTLIHQDWVLTAAHCIPNRAGDSITVLAGTNTWCDRRPDGLYLAYGEGAVERKVVKVIHPGYTEKGHKRDIALYRLNAPIIPDGRTIKTIPLATTELTDGEQLEVSGWGTTTEGGQTPCDLLTLTIAKIPDNVCRQTYGTDQTQICAGYLPGGRDSCQGDSGGPLVTIRGPTVVLHGVVSFGAGCARPGLPGVYTKVKEYTTWIRETMASN